MELDTGIHRRVRRGGETRADAGTESWLRARRVTGDPAWELTRECNGESVGLVDFGPMLGPNVGGVRAKSVAPEWESTRQFNGGSAGSVRSEAMSDPKAGGVWRRGCGVAECQPTPNIQRWVHRAGATSGRCRHRKLAACGGRAAELLNETDPGIRQRERRVSASWGDAGTESWGMRGPG